MLLTMFWFFVIIAAVVVLAIALLSKSRNQPQTNIQYFASPHAPSDYGQLYQPTGAPPAPQAAPPKNGMPANHAIPPQVKPPVQQSAPQFVPPQAPPKPPVPKKPFSPIPLLLIAGVVFLFMGGIIFLTNTWDSLPDIARAISLLSASVIAFAFNVLAERGLKLPKTGLAFYILGCIFLPLALGGIGAFSLLGEWFSFGGDGGTLLLALIFLCVSGTSFLGQSNYKSPFLAWLGLSGIAGTWTSLNFFLCGQLENKDFLSDEILTSSVGILQLLLSVICAAIAEIYLRRHAAGTTPLSRTWVPFLYPLHSFNLLILLAVSADAPLAGCLCSLVMALLFLHERFIAKYLHLGVFGFAAGLLSCLGTVCSIGILDDSDGFVKFLFVIAAAVFMLLSIAYLPQLKPATRNTMGIAGVLLCIPAVPYAFLFMLWNVDDAAAYFLLLFVPLIIAAVHFAFAPKQKLIPISFLPILYAILLYCVSISGAASDDSLLLRLLMIAAALILLIQAFLSRKLWPLMLSICTCIAVPLTTLPNGTVWLTWLCTAAMLFGMIYAHIARRPLLERSFGWAGLPFLLTSCCCTLLLFLEDAQAWILTLAVLALVFLAEYTILRSQFHSAGMRSFCLNLSVFLYLAALIKVCSETVSIGWLVLFALTLMVMTAGSLRRNNNLSALPMMIYLFVALREIVVVLGTNPILTSGWILGLQIASYIVMLLIFAGMGRLLLPDGFFTNDGNKMQADWGLLVASFPIFSVASTIDWYPSVLCCLLLSVYSLLFIGRIKIRFIPILLASAFGCLTIFFHNIHDPFGILELWHNADFKAPQILLYLLPMHIFILSLLWILPKKFRSAVHIARFCMYCLTMFCLLAASLNFGKAMDGIVLASFSFLILLGSFAVKRLRWFTLGFSVLFLMTVKMTWEFWQSLHWGIYLFLAGAALIGIAFYYEYAVRRANESANAPTLPPEPAPSVQAPAADAPNPNAPAPAMEKPKKKRSKEKVRLFKEWKW